MNNSYILNSIGNARKNNDGFEVKIDKKYRKGLLHLSLFSHINLIIECDKSNIFNASFSQYLFKIKEIQEKDGLIYVDIPTTLNKINNFIIYDIKPYFPNEDRVKNARVDNELKIQPNVFNKINSNNFLGSIKNNHESSILKINDNFESLVNYLSKTSHIKIFWWFDRFDKSKYKKKLVCKPPYENSPETGVFATRSPVRPNSIAMSTVKIISINKLNQTITISKLDCFDNTPLIGVSLYNPHIDYIKDFKLPQWLNHWSGFIDDQYIESMHIPKLEHSYIDNINTNKTIHRSALKELDSSIKKKTNKIIIKGAKQNNLKNINVDIPYNKITAITGISGSGKSTLAFDILYAESQQNFFSNVSLSERNQHKLLDRPNVDYISGLPPSICITQQHVVTNTRSTVGTLTGIHEIIRSIYANIGKRHCPKCGKSIKKLSSEEIVLKLAELEMNSNISISPYGMNNIKKNISIKNSTDQSIKTLKIELESIVYDYLKKGMGAIVVSINNNESSILQTTDKCYECNYILFDLSSSNFSYNNPESYCEKCKGTGETFEIDVNKIVEHPDKSILDNASSFWKNLRVFSRNPNANWSKCEVLALAQVMGIDLNKPWNQLPTDFQTKLLYGTDEKVSFSYSTSKGRSGTITRCVEGAYNYIKRLVENADDSNTSNTKYLSMKKCTVCAGERLKLENRIVTVNNYRFPAVANMSINELKTWVIELHNALLDNEYNLVKDMLQLIYDKVNNLSSFGLGYLGLNRTSPSLSGGELQRIQLVNQLSSQLSNILYILDEPSNALHPKDYEKLVELLEKLKSLNNTIVLVEHSPTIINKADYVIDIGGGSGVTGGYLIATGSPHMLKENKFSSTAEYISGRRKLSIEKNQKTTNWIKVLGVKKNNLKNIDITFPLNSFTCLTGVSGSGKSSLMKYGIIPAINDLINNDLSNNANKSYSKVSNINNISINKLVFIDQKPIGRSTRSTPATYLGIADDIRQLFASTSEAIDNGFTPNYFSFNTKEGQCSKCKGSGYIKLNSISFNGTNIICPLCQGKKFNNKINDIKYKRKQIHEVYNLSFDEALVFFANDKHIHNKLLILIDIGLGYLKLGQSSLTLSGGESQRIKMASELINQTSENVVYLFDEPTTGLHYSDIQNILNIFSKLIGTGNTVIIIEHNLDVVANADWIIDLGKEGGNNGGKLMIEGTPDSVSKCSDSYTGQYLSKILNNYIL